MSNEKLANKKSFVINNDHADMIVNDLLQGDFETLGHIFVDLVNYNVWGDETLFSDVFEYDSKSEKVARRLFKADSENYINNWISRSEKNSKNRKGLEDGQGPDLEELKDYARVKGYDEQAVTHWAIEKAHDNWKDSDGNPIRYWKKALDNYMRAVNRNRIAEMANTFKK